MMPIGATCSLRNMTTWRRWRLLLKKPAAGVLCEGKCGDGGLGPVEKEEQLEVPVHDA